LWGGKNRLEKRETRVGAERERPSGLLSQIRSQTEAYAAGIEVNSR